MADQRAPGLLRRKHVLTHGCGGQNYYVKPMNCPFHIEMYRTRTRSYRDLPMRWAELGTVYRFERSGVLHGLLRVRGFTQDDAHIFCRLDQMESEVLGCIDMALNMFKAFGFTDYAVFLSTRPEKSVGIPDEWERAKLTPGYGQTWYGLPGRRGRRAFCGPKIDIKVDALGRNSNAQRFNSTSTTEALRYLYRRTVKARPTWCTGRFLDPWSLLRHIGGAHAGAFPYGWPNTGCDLAYSR